MADNAIVTPNIYARLVLMDLGRRLNVCKNMSRSVSTEFGKGSNYGHKPGAKVKVKRPYRFEVKKGLAYQPQPIIDTELEVAVSQVAQIGYDWDSIEKTLSLREAMELYAKPAATELASAINGEAATFCAQNAMHSAGTPGTAPTNQQTYLTAGDRLVQSGLPENEPVTLIVNRTMSSAFVNGTAVLYNPSGTIAKQWNNGEMEPSLGYMLEKDELINSHTVGTFAGTPLVNGANQLADGGDNANMTLNTDGWTTTTLNKGDKFTLGTASVATGAGVMRLYPRGNRQSTGQQQVFTVVNQITDAAGVISPVIYPAITTTGPYRNCDSAPVDNAIITVIGTSGTVGKQGLLMHKTAMAFVSVPIRAPEKGMGALVANETDDETGISIQMIRAYDWDQSREVNKMLVLYDFARLYAEMACVIQGA